MIFGAQAFTFYPICGFTRSIPLNNEDVIFLLGTPRSNRITVYTGGSFSSRDDGENEFVNISSDLTDRFDDTHYGR